MAVANSTITPLPVRWRFPQEVDDDEDISLEQDSLGAEDDSDGGLQQLSPPSPGKDGCGEEDAWAPQRLCDSPSTPSPPVELHQHLEMHHLAAFGFRHSRCDGGDVLFPLQQCRPPVEEQKAAAVAMFDQEKWEKHKQLIRDYFETQKTLEEVTRRTADWNDPMLPVDPDWEPYRRSLLPTQSCDGSEQSPGGGGGGGGWTDALLPPIREQPGEQLGDDVDDRRSPSPSGDDHHADERSATRTSSRASPSSARGARPTLQLVGVTVDCSSSDGDGSVDSGRGASAASSPPRPLPPTALGSSPALRSHCKELSMDSGIQGSSCDLASGAASNASAPASDAGAEDLASAAATSADAARSTSSCSFPAMLETDPEALLHGETFNLVEEVYVVGNPLAEGVRLPAHKTKKAQAQTQTQTSAVVEAAAHAVVVAIDFGTTYSGYAFCFTRDPELNVHMMRKWEGGDPGLNNQKTPTTLLLTPDEEFHSFGFAARDFFHDLDVQDAKKWLFFDKFKMALHHDQDMHRDTRVQAANGRSLPALTVFAHALRHLKEQALRELSDQAGADLQPRHIRWVVTVPAIWRQPAKQFIREAAYQAGICAPECPEGLLIALEPEAASICCRKLRLNQLVPDARPLFLPTSPPPLPPPSAYATGAIAIPTPTPTPTPTAAEAGLVLQDTPSVSLPCGHLFERPQITLQKGMRYLVVDCGGGTVDVTVHELSEDSGTLRELHKATGGPWGSMGVDLEFERLLGSIFGEELLAQFKAKRAASFTELMVSWEARKRSASPHRDAPLSVFPPFSFIDFYRKNKGKEIEQAVRKYGRKEVGWSSQGALRLHPSVMRELFQPTIHKILRCIQDVLDSPRAHGIEYLFLVGGFAESQLLQHEVRTAFSTRVRVVIPQGVALTTLRGAVLFGLQPGVVTMRRSKHTYGVGVLKPFQHGVHPPEKRVERDGVQWCADVLDKFVSVEQSVVVGEAVVRRYTPALPHQSSILINIYCADSDDAQFTTDLGVRRCGALRLNLTSNGDSLRREIHTRMVFGGTEISASAMDLASGSCVQAEVDFLTV